MNYKRLVRLLIWILLFSICIYLRYYYDFELRPSKLRLTHTILNLGLFLLAFRILIDVTVLWYKLDKKIGSGRMSDNFIVGLSNLYSIFIVIAVILGMLSLWGLKLAEVFTTLSILAASIAIVSKDFIAEVYIGLYSGFSSKIELDDYIKVGDQKGKIIDIGLQKITLQNDDDDIVYIPNQKFYASEIINYTKRDLRTMSVEFELDINHFKNFESLEIELIKLLKEDYKKVIEQESEHLKITAINNNFIALKFQYTLTSVSRDVQRDIRKAVLRKVITYLDSIK